MEQKHTIPSHIGIIMDGNGRWAKKRGLPRTFGHREGANTFNKISSACRKRGVKYLTVYAFSTENWKRPKEEVDELMRLFNNYIDDAFDDGKENVRIIFLGSKEPFDKPLRDKMEQLEKDTAHFDGMTLMLAMNYGGRDDIVHATKKLASKLSNGEINLDDINEEAFAKELYTTNTPDVDLLIRPGGEYRISNFLLWQSAYAEFYFTDVLWPDFNEKELDNAIEVFSRRNRRFGGV